MDSQTLEFIIKFRKEADSVLRSVNQDLNNLADASDKVERAENKRAATASRTANTFGQIGGMVAQAVAAFAVIAGPVRDFAQLETAMIGVQKTTNLTDAEIANLQSRFVDLSRVVPVAAKDLADIAGIGGQLGVTGTQDLLTFTNTVSMMGVATNLAGEQAANALAKILQLTKEPISSAQALGSVIVGMGNSSNATESQIAASAQAIAQAAGIYGMTAINAVALGTAFSEVGVQAETGGTVVSRIFSGIDASAKGSQKEIKAFADIMNISTGQVRELARTNPTQFFNQLLVAMRTANQEGRNTGDAMQDLGLNNAETARTLNPLIGNLDRYNKLQADAAKLARENTALQKEADAAYGSFANQIVLLVNNFTALSVAIGEKFAAGLAPVGVVLNFVLNVLNKLDEMTGGWVSSIIAVVLALGAFVALSAGIAAMAPIFAGIGSAIITFLVIPALSAAAAFLAMLAPLIPFIATAALIGTVVVGAFVLLSGGVDNAKENLGQFFQAAGEWFSDLVKWAKDAIATTTAIFLTLPKAFSLVVDAGVKQFQAFFSYLSTQFGQFGELLIGVFTLNADKVKEAVGAMMSNAGTFARESFTRGSDLIGAISGELDSNKAAVTSAMNTLGADMGTSLRNGFRAASGFVSSVIARPGSEVGKGTGLKTDTSVVPPGAQPTADAADKASKATKDQENALKGINDEIRKQVELSIFAAGIVGKTREERQIELSVQRLIIKAQEEGIRLSTTQVSNYRKALELQELNRKAEAATDFRNEQARQRDITTRALQDQLSITAQTSDEYAIQLGIIQAQAAARQSYAELSAAELTTIRESLLLQQQAARASDAVKGREDRSKNYELENLQIRRQIELFGMSAQAQEEQQVLWAAQDEASRSRIPLNDAEMGQLRERIRLMREAQRQSQDFALSFNQQVQAQMDSMVGGAKIAGMVLGSINDSFDATVDALFNTQGNFFKNFLKSMGGIFLDLGKQIIAYQLKLLALYAIQLLTGTAGRGGGVSTSANSVAAVNPNIGAMLRSANGNAFTNTIVNSPTFFQYAGGQTGLMGEAGPEAIMPLSGGGVRAVDPRNGNEMYLNLTRDSSGRLGVVLDPSRMFASGGVIGGAISAQSIARGMSAPGGTNGPTTFYYNPTYQMVMGEGAGTNKMGEGDMEGSERMMKMLDNRMRAVFAEEMTKNIRERQAKGG